MKKLPFDFCVGCGSKIENIGGRRIVWSYKSGITLATIDDKFEFNSIDSSHFYIHKFSTDNRLFFAWGDWVKTSSETKFVIFEAIVREDNQRPWICQKCAKHALCSECGEPLVDAPATQVLRDDGSITNVPSLGAVRPCSNKNCIRSK